MQNTESKYAAKAIKFDSEGLYYYAILYYQRASETLTRLVEKYPDYKLNRIHLERASAYKNRIKALQMTIEFLDVLHDKDNIS